YPHACHALICLSGRRGGQQIDGAVELPKGIWNIAGRRVNLEEAVDFLWSVTIGDVMPVWADVELIDARADRRGPRKAPCHDTPPVVARSHIWHQRPTLVTGGARPQFRLRDVGTVQLRGLHAVQMAECRREGAVQLGSVDP